MIDTPWTETRFPVPSPITWVEVTSDNDFARKAKLNSPNWLECKINDICVATLEKRPPYCDRGHFWVKCFLRGLDHADMFPRYYMDCNVAQQETEKFLRWRLWKEG
jgi:hypothetical protein